MASRRHYNLHAGTAFTKRILALTDEIARAECYMMALQLETIEERVLGMVDKAEQEQAKAR